MTREQLEWDLARRTGESRAEIRRRGFGLFDPFAEDFDPVVCDRPQVVDWDELAAERLSLFP